MKPRVLLLAHRVPHPPDRGDRIRCWHLLQFLAQRADVSLAAAADEPVSAESQAMLTAICRDIVLVPVAPSVRAYHAARSLLSGRSITEGMFHSPALEQTILRWREQAPFDAAIVYCSAMFPYVDTPAWQNVPCLVDLVDVDSQKWSDYAARSLPPYRWIYARESKTIRRLERRIAGAAQAVALTTPREASLLRQHLPTTEPLVLTNGVDMSYFRPEGRAAPGHVAFVGVLNYRPNADGVCWFAEHVWPAIRLRHLHATFSIIGRRPTRAVQRLHGRNGVEVLADVPDVRPHLARAQAIVAPLQIARGIQNKVLEAMAMERPVVASPAVCGGLRPQALESGLLCAETATQWQTLLSSLLADPAHCERLGRAARRYVEEHHHWSACFAGLGDWLESLAGHFAHHSARHALVSATAGVSG